MERIDFNTLCSFVGGRRNKNTVLTFHSMGDTDAVSSAFSLAEYFQDAIVSAPDVITANSARVLESAGFDPSSIKTSLGETPGLVILLDVNNLEDCGPFGEKLEHSEVEILIIDHHAPSDIKRANTFVFNDESYNSAAGIVYALLEALGHKIDGKTADLLLCGIVSDSADLKNSFPDTFMQISKLLKISGKDYPSIVGQLTHIADPHAREKTLIDISGAKFDIRNNLLVVHGKAHSHANIAADASIRAGADLAIFYSESEKEVSFSARLRPPLDKEIGVHLGVIMKSMALGIRGVGGGHPCAAGAYAPIGINPNEFIQGFIERIEHIGIANEGRGK